MIITFFLKSTLEHDRKCRAEQATKVVTFEKLLRLELIIFFFY